MRLRCKARPNSTVSWTRISGRRSMCRIRGCSHDVLPVGRCSSANEYITQNIEFSLQVFLTCPYIQVYTRCVETPRWESCSAHTTNHLCVQSQGFAVFYLGSEQRIYHSSAGAKTSKVLHHMDMPCQLSWYEWLCRRSGWKQYYQVS